MTINPHLVQRRGYSIHHTPIRRVVAPTGGIVRGRFPSYKAGRMVDYEQLLERDALYLFDFCPLVQDIHEQPFKFHYPFEQRLASYTPDFALPLANGPQRIVEVKPTSQLQRPDNRLKYLAIQQEMDRQQLDFLLLTDKEIRQEPRLSILKRLHPLLITPLPPSHRVDQDRITSRLLLHTRLSLEKCSERFPSAERVLVLIAHGLLRCDLSQPLSPKTPVWLPSASEVQDELVDWL